MRDIKIDNLIKSETRRQKLTLNLIASENYVSKDVLSALGSPLTNKYSEGYPGKRYYPGNVYYDEIENLARERALKLFSLNGEDWFVNVQPYSGSPANIAVYAALLNPGETFMAMSLSHGGHLTHGHPVSLSGRLWRAVHYGVDMKTGTIDYAAVRELALKEKPKLIVSGFTAYPRVIDFKKFNDIALETGAYHMVDMSHIAGLVAGGAHPSPFPFADVVMTTTHKTLRGPRGAVIFSNRRSSIATRLGVDIPAAIDRAIFPGAQGGPHNNVTAAKAVAFWEASQPSFRKYTTQIVKNARALAAELTKAGFEILGGGTDNHLMLLNTRKFGLDGKDAEIILERAGITANRNSLPGDDKPLKPSGVRLGTPAVTTRGMKEKEMKIIASLFERLFVRQENPELVRKDAEKLCRKFPLNY